MRSRFRVVSGHDPSEFSRLLDRAESMAAELPAAKILDAIGHTARLDAVLRARYFALLAPSPPVQTQPDPGEGARYLDTARTARYLGVSRSTVVRLTRAGTLPSIHASLGTVRYDRQDLDALMARGKR